MTLTKQTWEEHILPKHPEVELNWQHIEKTLQDPENVSVEDDSRVYYKTFLIHKVEIMQQEVDVLSDKPQFMVAVKISNKFILSIMEKVKVSPRHQLKQEDENV